MDERFRDRGKGREPTVLLLINAPQIRVELCPVLRRPASSRLLQVLVPGALLLLEVAAVITTSLAPSSATPTAAAVALLVICPATSSWTHRSANALLAGNTCMHRSYLLT